LALKVSAADLIRHASSDLTHAVAGDAGRILDGQATKVVGNMVEVRIGDLGLLFEVGSGLW
jgi:hypothetical protein